MHSTPPINAPTTRRRFLSTAATLAAGSAAGAWRPAAAAESNDPIFAMIERHREFSAHCRAAYDISGKLHAGPEFDAADAVSVEKHDRLIDHADAFIPVRRLRPARMLVQKLQLEASNKARQRPGREIQPAGSRGPVFSLGGGWSGLALQQPTLGLEVRPR